MLCVRRDRDLQDVWDVQRGRGAGMKGVPRHWASCPSLPPGGQLCGVGLISSFLAPQFSHAGHISGLASGRLTCHSCCAPSELAGDLSPCPLGPGLRVVEIARTEGKSAIEGLSLAINGPRNDVCHILSQFIG